MMWNKAPTKVKCPRGDCKHYPLKPEENPCSRCTCNQYSDPLGRSFQYEPKLPINIEPPKEDGT